MVVAVTRHQDVAGHGHDHFTVHPAITLATRRVAVGFGAAVEAHRQQIMAPLNFPRGALTPPVVRLFALVAVVDDLVKDAVIISNPISIARQVEAGQ